VGVIRPPNPLSKRYSGREVGEVGVEKNLAHSEEEYRS
jgi:hypothetical protein